MPRLGGLSAADLGIRTRIARSPALDRPGAGLRWDPPDPAAAPAAVPRRGLECAGLGAWQSSRLTCVRPASASDLRPRSSSALGALPPGDTAHGASREGHRLRSNTEKARNAKTKKGLRECGALSLYQRHFQAVRQPLAANEPHYGVKCSTFGCHNNNNDSLLLTSSRWWLRRCCTSGRCRCAPW